VLELAREDQEHYSPGQPPPCWKINDIVKEQKARLKGASDEELEHLRQEAASRGFMRFQGTVFHSAVLERDVVLVPEGKQIYPGDEVIVIKREAQA
jgi:hypothetical protein